MNATKRILSIGWPLVLLAGAAGVWGCGAEYHQSAVYRHPRYGSDPAAAMAYTGPPAPVVVAPVQGPPATPPVVENESYDRFVDNSFRHAKDNPLSTFSIDVDTAGYANVRRFLTQGQLPPPEAVRVEEMINYFRYSYAQPGLFDPAPLAVHIDAASCPWARDHRLVRIGVKGRELPGDRRPRGNYVFLVDASGSMAEPNKLPLVKAGMQMLLDRLTGRDRVAIVVYADSSGLVLVASPGDRKAKIRRALEGLRADGCTNGGDGIRLAYRVAREHFIPRGVNRVVLYADGDFNVGTIDQDQLVALVGKEAASGVFLTVLGFGMANLKDPTLEKLADNGNGNYAYIDTAHEARKVLADQAADIGDVDPLKYQPKAAHKDVHRPVERRGELLTVKVRYKEPTGQASKRIAI